MGASLQGNGRGRGRYRPLSEINVTPLVDVMLVLLIIFMVTAPLLSSSVNVDLPKVNASPINQDSEPLQVAVNAQGQVFLMDSEVQLSELVDKLQAIARDQKDRRIFVRGDRTNTYGRMMEVMGTIIVGGFTKVSLVTEQVQGKGAAVVPAGPLPAGPSPAGPAAVSPASAPAHAVPAPSSSAASHRPGRG